VPPSNHHHEAAVDVAVARFTFSVPLLDFDATAERFRELFVVLFQITNDFHTRLTQVKRQRSSSHKKAQKAQMNKLRTSVYQFFICAFCAFLWLLLNSRE
jgi:hypothetical protein